MSTAEVTFDVAAFNTDAATHLPGDTAKAPRVAAQSAAPGQQRTGAPVLLGYLAKT